MTMLQNPGVGTCATRRASLPREQRQVDPLNVSLMSSWRNGFPGEPSSAIRGTMILELRYRGSITSITMYSSLCNVGVGNIAHLQSLK